MDPNIEKGFAGEEFVNNVAYSSFLKYWCFPGALDIAKDNKEICDLLVIFYPICLIISVKNYSFKGEYQRYFRKTVDKAIRQINGAEKTLFRNDPVLLKHPDREVELFEKARATHVQRIIVNLNQDVKYYKTSIFEDGKHFQIMDAEAWLAAINELNTLPDFVKYIEKRAALFNKYPAYILPRPEHDFGPNDAMALWSEIKPMGKDEKVTFVLGSEFDLIALYILNFFEFPKNLSHDNINGLTIHIDGQWTKYEANVIERKNKLEADSYFIDQLVKEFLIHHNGGDKLARLFFKMDRLERAGFAHKYLQFHKKLTETRVMLNRTHYVFEDKGLYIVFMYFSDDYPDDALRNMIDLSMIHLNYLFDFELKEIAVIGASKTFQKYSFGFSEGREDKPSSEELNLLISMFKDLGWMIK